MPGVTKRIYDENIRDIIRMWNTQLKSIQKVLPRKYNQKDIIEVLKTYYPHEWFSVEVKYMYYTKKD